MEEYLWCIQSAQCIFFILSAKKYFSFKFRLLFSIKQCSNVNFLALRNLRNFSESGKKLGINYRTIHTRRNLLMILFLKCFMLKGVNETLGKLYMRNPKVSHAQSYYSRKLNVIRPFIYKLTFLKNSMR